MIDIRPCAIAEIASAPNLGDLLAEYARESSLPELGSTQPQIATYHALESAGVLHPIGAFEGDRLVGFILPLVTVLPHYGVFAGVVESFFVPRAERKRGIGLRLLHKAESLARDLGAKALLLSAPTGGDLAKGMGSWKSYRRSNDVFVKALA